MNPPARPSGSIFSPGQLLKNSKMAIYCAVALLVILLSLAATLAG